MKENNNYRKNKIFILTRSLIVLFSMVIILMTVTFSWLRREYTPIVRQNGVRIVSGGALIFSLEDGAATEEISIIDDGQSDFKLKPVSNAIGKEGSFFTASYLEDENNPDKFIRVDSLATNGTNVKAGYLCFEFKIQSDAATYKHIYFNTDSKIYMSNDYHTGTAYKALRIAIQDVKTEDVLKLICACGKEGVHTHKAINAEGSYFTSGTTNRNDSIIAEPSFTPLYTCMCGYYRKTTEGCVFAYDKESMRYYVPNDPSEAFSVDGDGYIVDPVTGQQVKVDNHPIHFEVGKPLYDYNSTTGEFSTNETKPLSERKNTDSEYKKTESLFTLQPGESKAIRVIIWYEGEDENCTKDTINNQLDILLKFASITSPEGGTA